MVCGNCGVPVGEGCVLCVACEMGLSVDCLRLSCDLAPLRDSLDATLHPGGHQPVRVITAVPPTPVRLDVLDLLDLIGATVYPFLRRLDGVDALDWRRDRPDTDLQGTLLRIAGHPRLGMCEDSPMMLGRMRRLVASAGMIIDPPEERRPIGRCLNGLCGVELTAGSRDQWVTCPVCGAEERVATVRLKRLERLCFDATRRGSAAQVARTFSESGIPVKRNTITQWERRGLLARSPDGYAFSDVYRLVLAGEARRGGASA